MGSDLGVMLLWSLRVQAFQLLENFPMAVPYVFLITDGAVADERNICLVMQQRFLLLVHEHLAFPLSE